MTSTLTPMVKAVTPTITFRWLDIEPHQPFSDATATREHETFLLVNNAVAELVDEQLVALELHADAATARAAWQNLAARLARLGFTTTGP